MPELQHFPAQMQQTNNSCWASAARAISNWYQSRGESGNNPAYGSDQALATAWAGATGNQNHADINIQQSAAAALADLGYTNNIDDQALPTQGEIDGQIEQNRPLLAIVGGVAPNPNPNPAAQNGHWVVIVGRIANNIRVFDPEDGQIHSVPYNAQTYQQGSFWQNTSYVDPQ